MKGLRWVRVGRAVYRGSARRGRAVQFGVAGSARRRRAVQFGVAGSAWRGRAVQFGLIVASLFAPSAHACAVCFGAPNTPATHGLNNAIFFLLGVVGFVQVGFVSLFYTLWRRARELRRHREEWQVIDGGQG